MIFICMNKKIKSNWKWIDSNGTESSCLKCMDSNSVDSCTDFNVKIICCSSKRTQADSDAHFFKRAINISVHLKLISFDANHFFSLFRFIERHPSDIALLWKHIFKHSINQSFRLQLRIIQSSLWSKCIYVFNLLSLQSLFLPRKFGEY